jgi:hypothetical protein
MTEQQKKHPLYKLLMELKPYRTQFRLTIDGKGLEVLTPEPLPPDLQTRLERWKKVIVKTLQAKDGTPRGEQGGER